MHFSPLPYISARVTMRVLIKQCGEPKIASPHTRLRLYKRHGNPALEIERIYKAELELTQAKFKRSEVESSKHAASANWHAQESHVLRLENAKLRRMLRAHGHDRLCV